MKWLAFICAVVLAGLAGLLFALRAYWEGAGVGLLSLIELAVCVYCVYTEGDKP